MCLTFFFFFLSPTVSTKSCICFRREWRYSALGTNFPPVSYPVSGQPPPHRTVLPSGDGQQRSHIHHPFKIKRTMLVNVPFSRDNEWELKSAFPLFKDFIHRTSWWCFCACAMHRVLQSEERKVRTLVLISHSICYTVVVTIFPLI